MEFSSNNTNGTNSIEYLFDCIYHNKPEKVGHILSKAKAQLSELYRDLTIVERRKVTFLKSLLHYCEQQKWQLAKNQLEPAEEEYRKFFLHRLRTLPKQGYFQMHGTEMKATPPTGVSSQIEKYASQMEKQTSQSDKQVRGDTSGSKKSSASNKSVQMQREKMKTTASKSGSKRGSPVLMKNPISPRSTDTSKRETSGDIATMFESIYQNEWLAATEELREFKIDEKSSSSFLLNIVFEAYRLALMEADNQIGRLQTTAFSVLNGDFTYEGVKPKGDLHHLKKYRKSIAEISIHHLHETFKKRYLPEISRGIGIYQHIRVNGPIDKYTDVVTTVCWWMAVHVPPLHICDDRSQLNTFDESCYRFYSRTGLSVDFYVWPALKESENGKLLSKGVAEPKQTVQT